MAIDYSALKKPTREDGILRRRQRQTDTRTSEQTEKRRVVKRDGAHYCRLVPGCTERSMHQTAHLDDKGMGGDHGLRSTADQMVRACWFHHKGNWSLHSHDLRVAFLTADRANGPIEVWGTDAAGLEYLVGREEAVGRWERD